MIGSLFERLFGCPHRRLTRPITPVSRPGVPSGDTYVVCLDCGKQFAYDWDQMRIGSPIERSPDAGVVAPDTPKASKTRMKYALLGSAIPLGIILGNAILNRQRKRTGHGALDRYISLPDARFPVGDLVDHIRQSGRDYIIQGQAECSLANHPRPNSLDGWLRERYARNKDIKQATGEVVAQLLATGLFEKADALVCPDTGNDSTGLRLCRSATAWTTPPPG